MLLGAVGGPKWDGVPGDKRPEKGLSGQCLHARALRFLHPQHGEVANQRYAGARPEELPYVGGTQAGGGGESSEIERLKITAVDAFDDPVE